MCGKITYEVQFNGKTLDPTFVGPLQYDYTYHVFTFFTEDPNLIGTHDYTVIGYLTDYQSTLNTGSDIVGS